MQVVDDIMGTVFVVNHFLRCPGNWSVGCQVNIWMVIWCLALFAWCQKALDDC